MLPKPQLDALADAPLYRQLYESIRGSIASGDLSLGERLPPTRDLALALGINRATVSTAYELLESEGLIRGHVGRGSFVAAKPAATEVISFAASRPAAELFPIEEFQEACKEAISGPNSAEILQLGVPNGYRPMREYLLDQARAAGELGPNDDVLITSGCQQAFDLIGRALVAPGETVAIEDPVYPGLRKPFQTNGIRLVEMPVRPGGLDGEAVARVFERNGPDWAVVTPEFQNPTGTSLDLSTRSRFLKSGVHLVENDIYGDLRYEGERAPTLKALDPNAGTLLLRSFSKIAFPGLRVGWVIGPKELIRKLAEAKRWCDLHTDQLAQAVLLQFAISGRLAAHRNRVVRSGAERLKAALAACAEHLPAGSEFSRPQGGMHLWVRVPGVDTGEVAARAQRAGVAYLPGNYFSMTQEHPDCLRLSFAGLPPEQIGKGIALLGKVFKQELARAPEPAMV